MTSGSRPSDGWTLRKRKGLVTLTFLAGLRGGEPQRIETPDFELRPAFRAGEDLPQVHVELGDGDGVSAGRTRGAPGGAAGCGHVQLNSILTTRVVFVPPHSTRAEKEATQKLRSIPERVFPLMSRLRGW